MTKEYFEDHKRMFRQIEVISEVCYRKAMFYKYLYKLTGLKWAKDRNHYYVNEGMKLLIGCLGVCAVDIAILENYSKDLGE